MKYFLGLSSQYSTADVFRHLFATGDEYFLSELRAFLAAHYGATYDHVAVYSNGRTALTVALKAITKRGGKVVVTSLTCYAVVQAVKAAGCTPIFADVDPKTLHFGKKELEKAIDGETDVQAVIVQNNLGIPADIEGIEQVAKAHKLVIIEDLAHSAGVKYADGREAGTVGRAAVLSFGKGKSIDTVTGGAVVFTDPMDAPVEQPITPPVFKENFRARFYPLFSLMIRGVYYIYPKLGKYLTGALVRIHAIKRSADGVIDTKTRLTYWQCYLVLRQLQSLSHRGRPPLRDFCLVNDREELLAKLEEEGYFLRDIWYDLPVAPKRYFKKADFHPEACPVATKLADEIINLPTWYDPADLKNAHKIIKRYLVSPDEQSSDDSDANELLTESEKKAKIKAEKTERAKKIKAEKKAKKAKQKKLLKEDGAPDEEIPAEEKKDVVKSAKKKVSSLVAKVPKKFEEVAKKTAKKPKKSQKQSLDKSPEQPTEQESNQPKKQSVELSILEEKSDILSASEVAKIKESEQASREKSESVESTQKEPKSNNQPEPESQKSEATQPIASATGGMRQAPRKLTDREKLKLELEKGRKDGPSVV